MGLRAKAANSASNAKLINGRSCKLKKSTAVDVGVGGSVASETTCSISSTTSFSSSTTYRSSSASALVAAASSCLRPQTLNVHNPRETPTDHTQLFFGEILNAWRAKARCNVVPAERTQELFHELSFHPSDKQISEMLLTAKVLARKGSRQSNGLTFGEFCVLAADLKRFRTSTFSPSICDKVNILSSLQNENDFSSPAASSAKSKPQTTHETNCSIFPSAGSELRSTKSLSNVEDCNKKSASSSSSASASPSGSAKSASATDASAPVEVFLGGSCNPTTWRADVAIPALKELGISFYNPQVSDWTPDLIELEHRAKEKARVLFFVMDSETRASAGAIEAAHIAGQNSKQLVLVLHPYKPNQYILNEHISQQEYNDLMRNQLILKELVTRRGLPVLDNIPSGLQRTKEILAGIRDPPSNIATILIVVRGAFDRVSPVNNAITVEQCQRALLYLGYAQSLLSLDNLNKIIASQRESLDSLQKKRSTKQQSAQSNAVATAVANRNSSSNAGSGSGSSYPITSKVAGAVVASDPAGQINFELFCVISAYLSVLQQEIHESGCISPIKGTNVPPPPVYLANMQGDDNYTISYYASNKNISRTSSNASVPSNSSGSCCGSSGDERALNLSDMLGRSRDSGTSSPQPSSLEQSKSAANLATHSHSHSAVVEEESDSNDSVFSSSSSINSVNCSGGGSGAGVGVCVGANYDTLAFASLDFRDVYLGGSCFLRTNWRQDVAMPYLKSKGVTFHLPALHESIQASQLDLPDKTFDLQARTVGGGGGAQERCSFMRTRRKCRTASGAQLEEREEEDVEVITTASANASAANAPEEFNWALPPVRPNLFNPSLLDSSRVLLFVITNETRSLAPMTLAAHCIGLMYNVVLAVQMLPEDCVISNEKLTPAAIKDYNRGRSYLIDLAKRQGVPVFNDLKAALECTVDKIKACNTRHRYDSEHCF